MVNKKMIYSLMFLISCSGSALGANLKLLDFNADTFNERIWSGVDNPISLIQEKLYFLDKQDDAINIDCSEKDFEVEIKIKEQNNPYNSAFVAFSDNCRKIYCNHEDIDRETQVAVSMLFKRVSKKFLEHCYYLSSKEAIVSENIQSRKELSMSINTNITDRLLFSPVSAIKTILQLGENERVAFLAKIEKKNFIMGQVHVYKDELHLNKEQIIERLSKTYSNDMLSDLPLVE